MDKPNKRFSTDELTNGILRTRDFKRYLNNHADSLQEQTLQDHLERLLQEKGMKRADVIQRANLDRAFGYQIFDGRKSPSRDKVIQLAFGFGLNYEETCELLRVARKTALYARIKREAILIYAIGHNLSVMETQYMLMEAELPPLGQEKDK